MTIEKRKYVFGIPGKKEVARNKDVELRSPKLPLKDTICVMVNSPDVIRVFQKGNSAVLQKDKINEKKITIRNTLFSRYKYSWKKD